MAVVNHRKKDNGSSPLLGLSVALNGLFLLVFLLTFPTCRKRYKTSELMFHGGDPADGAGGNCFCNKRDDYCLCSPSLAIDLVIMSGDDHFWLVRRKDTNQLATMGGFVQIGESVEDAVRRELKEEMGLSFSGAPLLFGVYSDPRRDKRRHTTSAVFAIHLDGTEHPEPHDDVKEVVRIPISAVDQHEYFADHRTILTDYIKILNGKKTDADFITSKGDFVSNIVRSVCLPLIPS